MKVRLGKKPAVDDPRTLKLSKYLGDRARFTVPNEVRWSKKVPNFPMYENDRIGNCAIAGPAHQIQVWTANDGTEYTPTTEQVMAGYSRVGGYVPGDLNTDNGCVLLDVMRVWRNEGLCNHRIGAYALVDPSNFDLTRAAIHLFGGLSVGLLLPVAIQDNMTEWRAPTREHRRGQWERGSWGGHEVQVVDYDATWLHFVSWGKVIRMSWNFYQQYCDEAFAAISKAWLGPDAVAPNGFNARELATDLTRL